MILSRAFFYVSLCSSFIAVTNAFAPNTATSWNGVTEKSSTSLSVGGFLQDFFKGDASSSSPLPVGRNCQAKDLMTSLIEDKKCFSTEVGALAFGEACAEDVVYNDCYEPSPFVGKEVREESYLWYWWCMWIVSFFFIL